MPPHFQGKHATTTVGQTGMQPVLSGLALKGDPEPSCQDGASWGWRLKLLPFTSPRPKLQAFWSDQRTLKIDPPTPSSENSDSVPYTSPCHPPSDSNFPALPTPPDTHQGFLAQRWGPSKNPQCLD